MLRARDGHRSRAARPHDAVPERARRARRDARERTAEAPARASCSPPPARSSSIRRRMELGATEFLTKPFSPKKLYARAAELAGIDAMTSRQPRAHEPMGRRACRRRRLALLAAQHTRRARSSCCRSSTSGRCSSRALRRLAAARPGVAHARADERVARDAIAALRPASRARTSSPSRGRSAPVARSRGRRSEIERRGGPRRVMISRSRRLGDRRRRRVSRALCSPRRTIAEREHALVTVGVVPTRPDTGFGYIQPGDADRRRRVRASTRFVEKPDRATRRTMMREGVSLELRDLRRGAWVTSSTRSRALTPELAPALAPRTRTTPTGSSRAATPVAVDVGVLERSATRRRAAGRFRLGRRRHVGSAAPRARPRRAGQCGERRRACSWMRRTTSCTPREPSRAVRRARSRRRRARRPHARDDEGRAVGPQDADREAARRHPGARMSALYLYDDERGARLRAVRADAAGRRSCAPATVIVSASGGSVALGRRGDRVHRSAPHLADFDELDAPPMRERRDSGRHDRRERAVRAGAARSAIRGPTCWTAGGRVAAVRLARACRATHPRTARSTLDSLRRRRGDLDARSTAGGWTTCGTRPPSRRDARRRTSRCASEALDTVERRRSGGAVVGSIRASRVERGASSSRTSCFDTTAGPICSCGGARPSRRSRGSSVRCYVGEHSIVAGGPHRRIVDRRHVQGARRGEHDRSSSATRTRGTTDSSATRCSAAGSTSARARSRAT